MTTELLSDIVEYQCKRNLDLYDSPQCDKLATQAAAGRHLWISRLDLEQNLNQNAIKIQLCEDDYPGWLPTVDLINIELALIPYQFHPMSEVEIQQKLPEVIAFTEAAMTTPNSYLWGGTVGQNYDCSGLIQAAFAAVGIWLPRDAYQQEAFTQKIPLHPDKLVLSCLQPGDLIFFGTPDKATHVGLYLGQGQYIHSSGQEQGRNGIGIDVLSKEGDSVSQNYYQQLRRGGRVVASYQSGATPKFSSNSDSFTIQSTG